MSIYDVIKDDHRKVAQLFEDIRECKDADDRFALFENLREELTLHAKAEEKVVYDRLKGDAELKDQVRDGREEHGDMEALMAQIQDMEPANKKFMSKLDDLEELVNHHVQEEENDLLPRARRVIGDDKNNEIARELQLEKGRIQGRDFAPV